MSEHVEQPPVESERLRPGAGAFTLFAVAMVTGIGALLVALLLGFWRDDEFRRFFHAYLTSWAYVLSIALGALFLVLIQHLSRAGWSVSVRRLGETAAATLPIIAALAAPIVVSVAIGSDSLYPWVTLTRGEKAHEQVHEAEMREPSVPLVHAPVQQPSQGEHDQHHEMSDSKKFWLSPPMYLVRVVFYLAVWSVLGMWYWRTSVVQDSSGDPALTRRMEKWSAPALLILGVTLTLGAFDLVKSLDPTWYSTIFGVYFFAGGAVSAFAAVIVVLFICQRSGLLRRSVTREHYHDLGKYLFGFTFFWGYIAFSQYMLIWYAAIPEEAKWFARRGASTVDAHFSGWSVLSIVLLVGMLFVPFAGLMSRRAKRNPKVLAFWAAWILVFHWVDLYWMVMPEYSPSFVFGPIEVLTLAGIGGIVIAAYVRLLSQHALRPLKDPRLDESLAFENI